MTDQPTSRLELIIRCPPADPDRIPRELQPLVAAAVTIEHTRTPCSECDGTCWIGPGQRTYLNGPAPARPVCWICIALNPVHRRHVGNPHRTHVARQSTTHTPRRSSSWMVTDQ